MQNQPSKIPSENPSQPRHQIFWDYLNNSDTTQFSESYFNKFKRLIPKHELKPSDFMEPCSDGKTILENIAEEGHSDIIEHLFESYDDIDIDKKYNEGNTLLHIAVKTGNSQLAEFLIKKGARIEIINDLSEIPLTLCPAENNEIIELLKNTGELDSNLHKAIRDNDEEKIKELLQSGARPNGGITKVEDEAVTKGNVKIGKFVSNIRLAIESDSSNKIVDLLMEKYVKTTSNPLEIACSSNKENLFKCLDKHLSNNDDTVLFEKNIPNLFKISMLSGSVDMVKYFLNNPDNSYDINHKYETDDGKNALQIAISKLFHEKGEKEKYIEIIDLLIDKIVEKYPKHEEILSYSANEKGFSARFMLEKLKKDGLGEYFLKRINENIKQKEYEERVRDLEEGQSDSNPSCMTALCCCMNVNVERVDVVGNSQGVKADIVFEEKKLATPAEEAKTLQGETPKEQQPNTKPIEVKASSNINSMQKISKISTVSTDSSRVNTNSVEITLATTPAVTPYNPSQFGRVSMAIEASSTMSVSN